MQQWNGNSPFPLMKMWWSRDRKSVTWIFADSGFRFFCFCRIWVIQQPLNATFVLFIAHTETHGFILFLLLFTTIKLIINYYIITVVVGVPWSNLQAPLKKNGKHLTGEKLPFYTYSTPISLSLSIHFAKIEFLGRFYQHFGIIIITNTEGHHGENN